jgi:hypothetical protein
MTQTLSKPTLSLAQLRVKKEKLDEKKRELGKQTRELSEEIANHPDLQTTVQILQQSGGSKTTDHFKIQIKRTEKWDQVILDRLFETAGINEALWPFNREWVVDSTRMKNIRRDWPDHYSTLTDALMTTLSPTPYIQAVKAKEDKTT